MESQQLSPEEMEELKLKEIVKSRSSIIRGFRKNNQSAFSKAFNNYHQDKYTNKEKPTPYDIYKLYRPIASYYGDFMPSFEQWVELVQKLHELGIKKILGVACGKGGRESILYYISKMVLDEPFEMILTDGHLGQTQPTDEYKVENGITVLPVEHLTASEAIAKYTDVDAYLGFMLPLDIHSETEDDECPGFCIAESTYQNDKTLIAIAEGEWGVTGTQKYWEYVNQNLWSIHMIDIDYQYRSTHFSTNLYQKGE